MSVNNQEVNLDLFRLFKNVLEMMYSRGYDLSKFEKVYTRDLKYFNKTYNLSSIMKKPNKTQKYFLDESIKRTSLRAMISYIFEHIETKKKCFVFFADSGSGNSINKFEITVMFNILLKEEDCKNVVMIGASALGPQSEPIIQQQRDVGYNIQYFLDEKLMYNPTVSKYGSSILNVFKDEDANKFLKENSLTPKQIPKNPNKDIIAEYYDLTPGTIIEYQRYNMIEGNTLDENIYFRIVVDKRIDKGKSRPKEKKETI